MLSETYLDFEERFANSQTDYVVEQYLENSEEDIEIQHPMEVYSMLDELNNRSEDEQEQLVSHLDAYADMMPAEASAGTNGQKMDAKEIADGIREFAEGKELMYKSFDEAGFDVKSLVIDQFSAFLGDRLRYLPDSDHRR